MTPTLVSKHNAMAILLRDIANWDPAEWRRRYAWLLHRSLTELQGLSREGGSPPGSE